MKYSCLLHLDTEAFARLTPDDAAAIEPACKRYDEALNATGPLRITGSLTMPQTRVRLVPRCDAPERRSAPYRDDARQAGVFLLVEADDDPHAVRLASKHAAADIGERLGFALEVRGCDFYREA